MLGHPLAATIGDSARCMQNLGKGAIHGAKDLRHGDVYLRLGLRVVARYPNGNPFMSGRLIGDHILHNKPALVEVGSGKGKIIMFGFRPQNRAQPHGTFMLFFNSLYYGPAVTETN